MGRPKKFSRYEGENFVANAEKNLTAGIVILDADITVEIINQFGGTITEEGLGLLSGIVYQAYDTSVNGGPIIDVYYLVKAAYDMLNAKNNSSPKYSAVAKELGGSSVPLNDIRNLDPSSIYGKAYDEIKALFVPAAKTKKKTKDA